jgi:hypothetical protein
MSKARLVTSKHCVELGCNRGGCEKVHLLSVSDVQAVKSQPTFRMNMYQSSLLGLICDPNYQGDMLIRNVG